MKERDDKLAELKKENPGWGRMRLADAADVPPAYVQRWLDREGQTGEFIDIVKLNDWHIPYEDKRAVNCALNFCKETQPEIIIMDEVHDFYALSKFDKDPARKEDTQTEIDMATKYFKRLRKYCPDSRIILLESNHLDRLRRMLWKEGKAIASLRCLEIQNLLELEKLDIEYKPYFMYKGVMFKHGDLVRKYAAYTAKGEFEKEGCAGATGHTHRLGIHFTTKRGGSYCWAECGCLCDLNPEYINGVPDWQHGIGLFTFEKNGTQYFPQVIPIIHGKIIHGGKIITHK
jgi:hypothetical protein